MLSCGSASAQWYLFPNRRKNKQVQTQESEIVVKTPVDTLSEVSESPEGGLELIPMMEEYVYKMPDVLKVALILPFQANGKPNSNFLEMYCGVLLAIQESGGQGSTPVELTVIDESEPATPLTPDILEENHLIIGPVNYNDIKDALAICPSDRFIVSPLDPKAASLTDSSRVIQAPAHWKRQADEISRWIAQDAGRQDEIVVFRDSTVHNIGEQTEYLLTKLAESGHGFRTEARVSEFVPAPGGTTRVIIASDRDSYINGMVRDLSVLASQKHFDIVLYGTSSLRGSLGIDVEHLHNLQTHYTTGYFIDYENPAVSSFILSYRALFNNEPGQFAFQGYDTIRYFLGALAEYGEQWYKKLPEYSRRGLQTDYSFGESESTGKANESIRKVILGKDLSSYLVK